MKKVLFILGVIAILVAVPLITMAATSETSVITKLNAMQSDITAIKSNVSALDGKVTNVQTDVTGIKGNISALDEKVTYLLMKGGLIDTYHGVEDILGDGLEPLTDDVDYHIWNPAQLPPRHVSVTLNIDGFVAWTDEVKVSTQLDAGVWVPVLTATVLTHPELDDTAITVDFNAVSGWKIEATDAPGNGMAVTVRYVVIETYSKVVE